MKINCYICYVDAAAKYNGQEIILFNLKIGGIMKKLLICIVAICAFSNLSAQTKGDMCVGGNLGVGLSATMIGGESVSNIKFSLVPEFGYFAANNFKIGVALGYTIEDGSHILEIMPNIEYYVKICNGFYYNPGIGIGFVAGFGYGIAMPGFGVNLSLGSFEFRPTPKFGLSVGLISLSFAYLSYSDSYYRTRLDSYGVNFDLGINPSVGIKYYF